ncbi:MAG: DUF2236 domain-containing protein [Cyclobacteriaceae bacterium]|nr:DUF2236 domain-containing protein [Cyclobacteriaceae bacterium]
MIINTEILDQKRQSSDRQADRIVEIAMQAGKAHFLYETVSLPLDKLNGFSSEDPGINSFMHQKQVMPVWVDEDQLKRAAEFYRSYALEIMMLLGAVSLPSCYAASPGNKVLYLSEKIRKKPGKRLLETASFVIAISERNAFDENGPGYPAVQQVRLIHAMARHFILKSGKWDNVWGIPANEEDMLGTNLAFSYTVLKALKASGFRLKEEDLNAYLHLWKWVGYLIQIDETLLTDRMEEAEQLDLIIRERHFKKNPEGAALTRSLIEHYREALPGGLGFLVESQIKYFVGPEVGEMLGLRSSFPQDMIVRSLSDIVGVFNRNLPHKPTYRKMMKDHQRLKKMYYP